MPWKSLMWGCWAPHCASCISERQTTGAPLTHSTLSAACLGKEGVWQSPCDNSGILILSTHFDSKHLLSPPVQEPEPAAWRSEITPSSCSWGRIPFFQTLSLEYNWNLIFRPNICRLILKHEMFWFGSPTFHLSTVSCVSGYEGSSHWWTALREGGARLMLT